MTQDLPLYPKEDLVARAVLGPGREKEWPSIAAHDERHGLPKIDPVHGGRYWPAVERFYRLINHLDDRMPAAGASGKPRVLIVDTDPDGEENFGKKDAALPDRRADRRPIRQRA